MTRELTIIERATLAHLGWECSTTYATRVQMDAPGGLGIARVTITPAGTWEVTAGSNVYYGEERCIFSAALEANECAWRVRDGKPWRGSVAATYA